jgi:hypothetical protein
LRQCCSGFPALLLKVSFVSIGADNGHTRTSANQALRDSGPESHSRCKSVGKMKSNMHVVSHAVFSRYLWFRII